MAAQEQDLMCATVVQKLMTRTSLDDAEKSHLATCERCMAEVVTRLDESTANKAHAADSTPGAVNGDISKARPTARKALEHGLQVFQREFGISLSRR